MSCAILDPRFARDLTADSYAILPIKARPRAGVADFTIDTEIVYSAAHGLHASRAQHRQFRLMQSSASFGSEIANSASGATNNVR